jgi:TorA maturation chaperone TorD
MEPVVASRPRTPAAGFAGARPDCYALLAALLGPPTPELLHLVRGLTWDATALPTGLDRSFDTLLRAAGEADLAALEDDHRPLFIGLGSGELVPYASWYREHTLQAAPLAAIRDDLMRLGIVRVAGSCEPEDSAAALCEVMALISRDGSDVSVQEQARFFREHLATWMGDFFADLRDSRPAGFYRAVGELGGSYLDAERTFLGIRETRFPDGRKVQRWCEQP